MKKREARASMTIEAAFLLGILLIILAGLMKESIHLYEQVKITAQEAEVLYVKPVEDFLTIEGLKKLPGKE